MATFTEYALANIARVDIVTEETIPVSYSLTDVSSEAEVIAFVSEGSQTALRVKNTIKAQNNFEDIVMGYDIKLVNATMIPEILALIDGGTYTVGTKSYVAPVIGAPVVRKPFTMKIYAEQKDGDGAILGYICFEYKNCKGKPVDYTLKDGEFFVPEMSATSRPKLGQSPVTFNVLTALPA